MARAEGTLTSPARRTGQTSTGTGGDSTPASDSVHIVLRSLATSRAIQTATKATGCKAAAEAATVLPDTSVKATFLLKSGREGRVTEENLPGLCLWLEQGGGDTVLLFLKGTGV